MFLRRCSGFWLFAGFLTDQLVYEHDELGAENNLSAFLKIEIDFSFHVFFFGFVVLTNVSDQPYLVLGIRRFRLQITGRRR